MQAGVLAFSAGCGPVATRGHGLGWGLRLAKWGSRRVEEQTDEFDGLIWPRAVATPLKWGQIRPSFSQTDFPDGHGLSGRRSWRAASSVCAWTRRLSSATAIGGSRSKMTVQLWQMPKILTVCFRICSVCRMSVRRSCAFRRPMSHCSSDFDSGGGAVVLRPPRPWRTGAARRVTRVSPSCAVDRRTVQRELACCR